MKTSYLFASGQPDLTMRQKTWRWVFLLGRLHLHSVFKSPKLGTHVISSPSGFYIAKRLACFQGLSFVIPTGLVVPLGMVMKCK
ncbi:unnamed protein product [Lactuca virosa]|uniref:Uncharacterized protein n=1 Tax=Lactuca virosa TaxID=75947 RepID=A0AAU9P9Q6_9ASTR|nr:unnamed protein product [Lactuca virosa]